MAFLYEIRFIFIGAGVGILADSIEQAVIGGGLLFIGLSLIEARLGK